MSACRLVLDSVCRSNHHRLAVLALTHLTGEEAGAWRNVFLKHRTSYLDGAKAPDELFRDFRNHVLHVREGDWGGAREAAREWYRRTVRALQQEDWAHAAWCAGVMSHYVVDPIQPFHTHQTEEEGVIHRALESALSRAFRELHAIVENELGWPEVPVPQGDDWLEKMIRAGAAAATKHYEAVIDHYDIEAGHRRPEAGLDQELKDIFAALIAYASVTLARVLDRAIAEAAVAPPNFNLALDQLGIVLSRPGRALEKRVEDVAERRLVLSQYAEFRMTGKVRETMSEDDRVVRRLHAEEVLKVNVATLDAAWPRETGTKNGQGAAARNASGRKRKLAPVLELRTPAPEAPKSAEAAAPPPKKTGKPKLAPEKAAKPAKGEAKSAKAQPAAAPAKPRLALSRDASVVDAPSIGPKTAGRLNLIGVKTVGDLLEVTPEDAAARIKQGHINAQVIKDWQAQALLACTVPELSALGAQLLVGAGVSTVEDLATADPDFLVDAVAMFAASGEGERALRGQPVPDRDRLKFWIEAALAICESRTAA
jgi:predicted flap endonuclease-1-like 5' DNA nuclease